jgi:cation transport regulator
MPYEKCSELPDSVQNVLPKDAQQIYMAAFNSAWDDYKDPDNRDSDDSREEVAHKVAWAAVKQRYSKNDVGDWVAS